VDDLLDISRVTRGYVDLRNEQVTLALALDRAVEMAAPLISRGKHVLRVASSDGVTLKGDPVRLAQIFGNLLTNAAKFTPPGGTIGVSVEQTPGRVRIAVRDNGRGIGSDQLQRIFEPFVQADRAQDALQGGLGLGLAIVKNLVERHDGTITAHSEGRGQGAVFTVELPTVAAVAKAARLPQPRGPAARKGVRILLVDDNVDIADLLSTALEDEGYQTAVAHDGKGALETWRRFLPHAAILDVGLPDVDGYEVAKTVRAEYGVGATLIAATGYGQPKDRSLAAAAGFDCHLVKPVSVHDLIVLLDERVASPGDRKTASD
jgi:CheY-like chemotaxis protein/anti-sigma regulatory factor (Ser/Thr protein kinase)